MFGKTRNQYFLIRSCAAVLLSTGLLLASDFPCAEISPETAKANKQTKSLWEQVKTLKVGQKTRVYLKDEKSVEGGFLECSSDSLSLQRKNGSVMQLEKPAIKRVAFLEKGSRKRKALAGALVGFGIGFGLGYWLAPGIADVNQMKAGERVGFAAGVGGTLGGIGAGITALMPAQDERVIYESR
jgi:hypothetical protein